jgi:type 1 glutamine amidotransferase
MTMRRTVLAVTAAALIAAGLGVLAQQAPPSAAPGGAQGAPGRQGGGGRGGRAGGAPARKKVLAWADTRNGVAQHESVGHALAIIERLGYESGMWDTFIRTDSNIISKAPKKSDGSPASGGPSLANVDAIFYMGHRDVPLDAGQKEELLQFVKDGHGFVAAHVALTSFETWPEFGDLIGARFDQHPIVGAGTVINEEQEFPATKHFPASFPFNDEFYQPKDLARDKVDVVLRLDLTNVPANPALHLNGDYPLAWAKTYGKGRVFYGSFAHANETWDLRSVQQMYFEAMRWALGLTDAEPKPHPMRGEAAPAGRGRGGQ